MKPVCLIRPPRSIMVNSYTSGTAIPPIGLAYLISFLENNNQTVTAIDAIGESIEQYYDLPPFENVIIQGMRLEEIVDCIPKDPLLIGISCMFSCEWFLYEALIKIIKSHYPHVPIVLGGEHVTAEAENIFKVCKEVDICVLGEGEVTLLEISQKLSGKEQSLESINGIVYLSDGRIVKNKSRERIKDLNAIPLPAWDKIPVRNYHRMGYSMASKNRKAMPLLASRGCPYRCTFCSSPQMWGTDLFLRDPRSIVEEIKSYVEKYEIEHIDFLDIVGVLNRAWVKELLTILISEKLPITWLHSAGTRSEILDEEVLKLFKESKALRIFYAPESGSKETLKRIKKRVNIPKIVGSMKMAHRMGISMRAPLIYGFPGQTLKEAFENLIFSFKLSYLGVDDVVAHIFSAYPGSELFQDLNKRGEIDLNHLIQNDQYNIFLRNEFVTKMKNLHSWSADIPSWTLPFFQFGGMAVSYTILFLFHPTKFFKMLHRVFYLKKPLTLLDHVFYGFFYLEKIVITKPKREM